MYVWEDSDRKQWVVHDGVHVITVGGAFFDLEGFYRNQKEWEPEYDKINKEFTGSQKDDYGVKVNGAYVTVKNNQLEVMYSRRPSNRLVELEDFVKQLNKNRLQKQLTEHERGQLHLSMEGVVPDEYWDDTNTLLSSLTYQSDIHLVYDTLAILNKWVERDGFTGVITYTEQGLQIDFGLEHPIMIHVGSYGKFSSEVDQTFLAWVQEDASLHTKVTQLFEVYLDFYKWLNPLDLSYQTNKILGDDRIRVTLKDTRVLDYQQQIRSDFQEFQNRNRGVKHIDLKFSHTTRSVYANIEFFNGIPTMRLSVRDHDNCYEEGITIIRINTLKAMNVVEKLEEVVGNYINKLKTDTQSRQHNQKEGVTCGQ